MSSSAQSLSIKSLSNSHKVLLYTATCIILFLWVLPFTAELNGEEGPTLLAFFGRFHIVVLHLPIGWLLLVPLLEGIAWRWGVKGARTAAGFVLFFGAISAVVAVTLGFSLAVADAYAGTVVTTHMWLGIVTATTAILAYLLRELRGVVTLPKQSYPVMLTVSLLAVTYGGHLGGTLVQGEGYLTARLPVAIKLALNIPTGEAIPVDYDANIYASIIEPIFRDSCITCHNDQKFKGKYSMASHESLLQGGKSEQAVVIPNDHESSELYRRISLVREDDDAMPPSENPPLADSEVALISWWIDIGAPIAGSINELAEADLPQQIANIVDDLIASTEDQAAELPSYDQTTLAVQAELLKSEFGLDVYALSQSPEDGLRIEAINSTQTINGQTLQALLPLADYIRELDFSKAVMSAGELATIENFSNLESLSMNNATLVSEDLSALGELNLKSLNLFGTSLGAEATQHLAKLRTLRHLYVGETGLSAESIALLSETLPRCEIL